MNLVKKIMKDPSYIPFFILAAVVIGSWAYSAIEPHYWESLKAHYPMFLIALVVFVLARIVIEKLTRRKATI
jgi:hypothetical protein